MLAFYTRGKPTLTFSCPSKTPADYWGKSSGETELLFFKGELLHGCMDKAQYGKFGLVHAVQVHPSFLVCLLPFFLPVCLSVHPSMRLSCLSGRSVCLVGLSGWLAGCLYVCLSVCACFVRLPFYCDLLMLTQHLALQQLIKSCAVFATQDTAPHLAALDILAALGGLVRY